MKASVSIQRVILFAGMTIVAVAQWRMGSRLRRENQELQGVREQFEQTRAELDEVTRTSTLLDSEVQSLRDEAITLRVELGLVRQDLREAKSVTGRAATAAIGAVRPTRSAAPSSVSSASGRWPYEERTVFHMHPNVRTNLETLPSDFSYAFKSGGRVDDVELWNGIPRESISAGPDWSPSLPLPLTFTEGEAIARKELGRLVNDEPGWEVREVHLYRQHRSSTKWHYAFRFEPTDRSLNDNFTVHVNMAGIPGTTGLRGGE